MALVDSSHLRQIIEEGNNETLVKAAEDVGQALAKQFRLATSQVRSIFGTVRQIEMDWPYNDDPNKRSPEQHESVRRAKRELMLLKPRIAYQAKRERGLGVRELELVLSPAIDLIKDDRQRFQNFVDFFEAILAYHRAHGGTNN